MPDDLRGLLWGIDIGGTKVAVGVGDASGEVVASDRFAADPSHPPEDVLSRALERLGGLAPGGASPAAIGVACPGPFDRSARVFLDPPNMPAWHGFRLGEFLDARAPARAVCMNDANATALAEHRWGAGRGADSMVYLTMSTGFGAGIVLDGRVVEGPRGFAGEVGRIVLSQEGPIGFGARGTVEGFLSGPGMVQQARDEAVACAQRGEETGLRDPAHELSPSRLCELASAGDGAARRVTDRVAARLGQLVAILANVLEPQRVVLGTIAQAHPALFLEGATIEMRRHSVRATADGLTIVTSELGDDRGVRSALALAALADR